MKIDKEYSFPLAFKNSAMIDSKYLLRRWNGLFVSYSGLGI